MKVVADRVVFRLISGAESVRLYGNNNCHASNKTVCNIVHSQILTFVNAILSVLLLLSSLIFFHTPSAVYDTVKQSLMLFVQRFLRGK